MSYGSTQYDRSAGKALAPRDLEAAAFAFVNELLENAQGAQDRVAALGRNHRLWSLLLTDVGMSNNGLPTILKKDLVSVGSWSMSYSIAAMGRDLPVAPLIDVNRDMMEALRLNSMPKSSVATAPSPVEGVRINLTVAV